MDGCTITADVLGCVKFSVGRTDNTGLMSAVCVEANTGAVDAVWSCGGVLLTVFCKVFGLFSWVTEGALAAVVAVGSALSCELALIGSSSFSIFMLMMMHKPVSV